MSRLVVGAEFERRILLDADLVRRFADASGDRNPMHLDAAAAIAAGFPAPVAHGMLLGALVSAFLSDEVTGAGATYVSQSLQFRAPAFVGQRVVLRLKVTGVDPGERRVTIRTLVLDDAQERLVVGEAMLRMPA